MLMSDCGIMPHMDIRILRYFIAVAEEGNITKAAARLHVSQPALSTQLAALEDELGQRLFERGARGIELTEKGLVLKGMVREFIAGWLGFPYSRLDVVATYNLFYNAAMFVEAGLGAAICIDGVVPHEFASRVAFRPFSPALTSDVYLAWRKNAALSPAAAALVENIRNMSSGEAK